jgi:hypothetical protein
MLIEVHVLPEVGKSQVHDLYWVGFGPSMRFLSAANSCRWCYSMGLSGIGLAEVLRRRFFKNANSSSKAD